MDKGYYFDLADGSSVRLRYPDVHEGDVKGTDRDDGHMVIIETKNIVDCRRAGVPKRD